LSATRCFEHLPVSYAVARQRLTADFVTLGESQCFLANVPDAFRDLYSVWFQVGWCSSEIVALWFGWLDFLRRTIVLQRARIPRWGGVEAEPKTGRRLVDVPMRRRSFRSLSGFFIPVAASTATISSSSTAEAARCPKSG
jgi:hypothetical protein